MDRADLAFAGVARQLELLAAGETTSRELTETYLERIERLDPQLNTFRIVYTERALADADEADARRAAGEERPLLGIPIALKDNMDQAGELNPNGTGAYGPPAAQDCDLIARLRAAGAIFLGRVLCPELSIIGATESPTWGVTRNPWDTERTTGGSSGGSAAAVAAGLAAAATGSDGGGSIRIPAANCGVFGLKPQRDRVSLAPDPEHWYGLTAYGFVSRSVLDSALLYDAVTDADGGRRFAESARTPPGKLRIAVSYRGPVQVPVDSEVRRLVEETVEALRGLGHEVVRADPKFPVAFPNAVTARYLKGVEQDVGRVFRPERLSRRTRGFARLGRLIPGAVLDWARRSEADHAAAVNRILEDHDVLITPVTARPPAAAAQWEGMSAVGALLSMLRWYPYTISWNATGQPAAAVPAGLTQDGLPVAAQLIGRPADDTTVLSLAGQLEAERPWTGRRPQVS